MIPLQFHLKVPSKMGSSILHYHLKVECLCHHNCWLIKEFQVRLTGLSTSGCPNHLLRNFDRYHLGLYLHSIALDEFTTHNLLPYNFNHRPYMTYYLLGWNQSSTLWPRWRGIRVGLRIQYWVREGLIRLSFYCRVRQYPLHKNDYMSDFLCDYNYYWPSFSYDITGIYLFMSSWDLSANSVWPAYSSYVEEVSASLVSLYINYFLGLALPYIDSI